MEVEQEKRNQIKDIPQRRLRLSAASRFRKLSAFPGGVRVQGPDLHGLHGGGIGTKVEKKGGGGGFPVGSANGSV